MTETEGVIKYELDFQPAPAVAGEVIRELNAWRRILYLLRMIGQDPKRYLGYGYGNVSARLQGKSSTAPQPAFVITGTQTGDLSFLHPEHYVTVQKCYIDQNKIVATGPIKPSSEALTHGSIYKIDSNIQFVFHVHSPEIWNNRKVLGIVSTQNNIAYGTPEMAQDMKNLFEHTLARRQGILTMASHEHGVVTFGATASEAGIVLIDYLSRALQLD